jgi:putative transposase
MWTPATRRRHSRAGLRYASDLTDDEWRVLEPLLPGAPGRGRRRAWPLREIANAIWTPPITAIAVRVGSVERP